jgi:conjugative transposon TraN protein
MQPIELDKMVFSNLELRKFAMDIIRKKSEKHPIREEKNLKLNIQLNNVYVMSDYIFLDITFKNNSNLSYDIEDLKFSIEDKKIYKATNNQSIEMTPIFQLNPQKHFSKNFRNIYVFKKFTFPNSKVMMIRLIEEQLSGRTIEMKVNYSDILKADTF